LPLTKDEKTNSRPGEPDETTPKTEARVEFGRDSEYPVSYNVTKGQTGEMSRHLSRNELAIEAKADCRPKPKQMVDSPELFGEVASPDSARQTAGKHPNRITIDFSMEADETIANTGTVGRYITLAKTTPYPHITHITISESPP